MTWLSSFRRPLTVPSRRPAQRPPVRLAVESLEDRTLLSGGWVSSATGTGDGSNPFGLALDTQGNSYLAGVYRGGPLTFGSTTLAAPSGPSGISPQDGYVVKYDPNGSPVWAKTLGDGGAVATGRITTDASGNSYVAGSFSSYNNPVTFGSFTLTNPYNVGCAFLAKLDPAGNVAWVRQFQPSGAFPNCSGVGVAVDGSGNVYINGNFDSTTDFGSGITLTPSDAKDGYVAKLDSSGTTLWARRMGSETGVDFPLGLTADPAGNVYATGWFVGSGHFGSTVLTSKGGNGQMNAFVTRLDPSGNFQWAQRLGGEVGSNFGFGIAIDSRATDPTAWALYLTGEVSGTNVDIGATTFAAPNTDAFVARMDATTGSFTWGDHFSSSAESWGLGVGVDGAGNVYAGGTFPGTTDFDPGAGTFSLSADGGSDYVCKLDGNGNFLSAWQTTGSAGGHGGLATNAAGDVWIAGGFGATTTFPTGQTYSPNGVGRPFVMRMNAPNAAIVGSVYLDQNQNGSPDAGEATLPSWTVYADLNNNGVRDAGEPSATSTGAGSYQIGGLAPGTYTVRVVLPSGWTASGSPAMVAVGEGTARNTNLGAFAPTTTRTYSNSSSVRTTNKKPNAVSTLAISDAKTIYDVHLTLNVSNAATQGLTVILRGPDGTSVTLVAGAALNGTVTYETPAFNSKMLKGTWTLEVDGLSGGTLNSWSLSILEST